MAIHVVFQEVPRAYTSVGAIVPYRLRTGNRFPPMKHKVTEVLYIYLAIKRFLLFYPKSSFWQKQREEQELCSPTILPIETAVSEFLEQKGNGHLYRATVVSKGSILLVKLFSELYQKKIIFPHIPEPIPTIARIFWPSHFP